MKAFHAHILRQPAQRHLATTDFIPIVNESARTEAIRIFHDVKSDIRQLINDQIGITDQQTPEGGACLTGSEYGLAVEGCEVFDLGDSSST